METNEDEEGGRKARVEEKGQISSFYVQVNAKVPTTCWKSCILRWDLKEGKHCIHAGGCNSGHWRHSRRNYVQYLKGTAWKPLNDRKR